MVRRPEHLDVNEEARLRALLESPIGIDLRVARHFLTAWYAIGQDEMGKRRDTVGAHECYETWQTNLEYRRLAPLRRIQQSIDAARFDRLSHFLRDPLWEATNNGGERMGRTFRHRQKPHFNLRTTTSIEEALRVRACLHHDAVTSPLPRSAIARRGDDRADLAKETLHCQWPLDSLTSTSIPLCFAVLIWTLSECKLQIPLSHR